jgi:hypothetical protein
LGWALSQGLVEQCEAGRMRLTQQGRLISNEIFVRLLPETLAAA